MNNGDKRITRKDFFSLVGWGGILSTLAGSVLGFYRFYFPNILYESQKVFKIGKPEEFPEGLSEKWKKERQVWVARNKSGI
ncbi:MAG: Rieske (2Fe-2S) protein, partial [Deltaproteobacteria bacterium]